MGSIIGWDIGGAHLKAARNVRGRIVATVQVPSPLRFGLQRLSEAFAEAKAAVGSGDRHAITMTGELADTFADRHEGVVALTGVALRELAPAPVQLFAGRAGFIAPSRASECVADIASANWYATALIVARHSPAALLIDMGSTTTDIIPVASGNVVARGYTDAERLRSGELVYTGMVRSFLMASAERAPFAGEWSGLVRENFANMADVYRILGALPEGADQMSTADGRDKTVPASQARIARMIGCDAGDADPVAWSALAHWFAELQIRAITDSSMLVLSREALPPEAPIVSAGIGTGVVAEVARRLGRPIIEFADLLVARPETHSAASSCAPAAAVALLAGFD